jgi:polysaccharide biosynthesis/export protein
VTKWGEFAKNPVTNTGSAAMDKPLRWILSVLILGILALNEPVLSAPYKVRAGDTLEILVWQDPKLNRQLVVAPDGRIAFPLAGHLQAGGRTLEAIEGDLKNRLKKQFADDIDITVSLLGSKEKPFIPPPPPEPPIDPSVYVTGEVGRPGQYFFRTRTNVLQAIALAGGLGPFAAERRIKIRRKVNGEEVLYDFDYDAFTSGEDLSGNINLRSGDVIIVPEKGLFE